MTRKLTLSMDERTIDKARKLAKSRGTSISKMLSQYIEKEGGGGKGISPRIKAISGILRLPKGASERDVVRSAAAGKHGVRR